MKQRNEKLAQCRLGCPLAGEWLETMTTDCKNTIFFDAPLAGNDLKRETDGFLVAVRRCPFTGA